MKYFTPSPFERLMMQKPKPRWEDEPPTAPPGHPCHGCKRYGLSCVHPCYREMRGKAVQPCAL